jgi:DNA polymerase elongation subunit (family B)
MDEELEKLYQDLINNRQIYRGRGLVQVSPPQPHQNLIDNPFIANYDFASLYPSIQKSYYKIKQMIRKRKIQRIFQNPS